MTPKMVVRICVDIGMTAVLLFLMTYEMIGQAFHEWLGIGMFVLFVMHHILNRKWFGTLLKGKYTPLRIWQTILVVLVFFFMTGSMVSSILISHSVLSFLPIHGGSSFGRDIHMLSAYWGFVMLSLHLRLHWNMMMGMAGKLAKKGSVFWVWVLRVFALMIAAYGLYVFAKRDIGDYMFFKSHFVFFNYEEPLMIFLLDYIAAMGLFIVLGHYSAVGLKQIQKRRK